jgi:hypothetical protein
VEVLAALGGSGATAGALLAHHITGSESLASLPVALLVAPEAREDALERFIVRCDRHRVCWTAVRAPATPTRTGAFDMRTLVVGG